MESCVKARPETDRGCGRSPTRDRGRRYSHRSSGDRADAIGSQAASLHGIAALFCLLLAGCQPAVTDWMPLNPRVPAPAFTAPQLGGGVVQLSDYQGRVVILEFWATWCPPCRFTLPSLESIYNAYRNRGVGVLLINQGETDEAVRAWAGSRFKAPILMDRDLRIGRRYDANSLPHLVIIDQRGNVAYVHSGYRGGLEHNLTLILDQMLNAKGA